MVYWYVMDLKRISGTQKGIVYFSELSGKSLVVS